MHGTAFMGKNKTCWAEVINTKDITAGHGSIIDRDTEQTFDLDKAQLCFILNDLRENKSKDQSLNEKKLQKPNSSETTQTPSGKVWLSPHHFSKWHLIEFSGYVL